MLEGKRLVEYVRNTYGLEAVDCPNDVTLVKEYHYGYHKEVNVTVFRSADGTKYFRFTNSATGLTFCTMNQDVFGLASQTAERYNEYNANC